MIVVKVGGSLYDIPELGPRLRSFLAGLAPEPVLLVPGGGGLVDAVRALDATHGLGQHRAHWLALEAMDVAGSFLLRLIPGAERVAVPGGGAVQVLAAVAFCRSSPGPPESWDATSDSIAAWAAARAEASRLILLKSVDAPPVVDLETLAREGHVDPLFPRAAAALIDRIEFLNFRTWAAPSAPL